MLDPRHRKRGKAYPVAYTAAGLAAICGLRSTAGPALLSRAIRRREIEGLYGTPLEALGSQKVSTALRLLMVGEMAADKSSMSPSRTSGPGLLGRALSGALVGAALFISERKPGPYGAMLGIASAIPTAYVAEKLRVETMEKLGVPNPVLGLLEDGITLLGGTRLLRKKP